jgi:hypothetical protein
MQGIGTQAFQVAVRLCGQLANWTKHEATCPILATIHFDALVVIVIVMMMHHLHYNRLDPQPRTAEWVADRRVFFQNPFRNEARKGWNGRVFLAKRHCSTEKRDYLHPDRLIRFTDVDELASTVGPCCDQRLSHK